MSDKTIATKLNLNDVIIVDNNYFQVLERNRSKVARGGTTVKLKLKNLSTGSNITKTYGGDNSVELAEYNSVKGQFLYQDEMSYYFMEKDTFEQYEISTKKFPELKNYLVSDLDVFLNKIGDSVLSVNLPPKVRLKVVESPPSEAGDTADGSRTKQIKLETGLQVNAPMFIREGEQILVNTVEGTYVERAK